MLLFSLVFLFSRLSFSFFLFSHFSHLCFIFLSFFSLFLSTHFFSSNSGYITAMLSLPPPLFPLFHTTLHPNLLLLPLITSLLLLMTPLVTPLSSHFTTLHYCSSPYQSINDIIVMYTLRPDHSPHRHLQLPLLPFPS